jgi:hypothetical protein
MSRGRTVVGLTLGAAVFLVEASSCNGSSFSTGTSDAGADGLADQSVGPLDAGGAICAAETTYYDRCMLDAPCDQTNLKNCAAFGSSLSAAAVDAYVACGPEFPCSATADPTQSPCVAAKLAMATPTAAQLKLATDYCMACGQSIKPTCDAASFYSVGAGGAANGVGFYALLFDDAVIHVLDTTCIPTSKDASAALCEDYYLICEAGVLKAQVPVDACTDGAP